MNSFSGFCRVFLWGFLFIPALLHAKSLSASSENTPVDATSNTLSAETSTALPEIVVTANRLDTPISQVASSMTVITRGDIEEKQADTALDALSDAPGLTLLQEGGPGESTGIFIRGADAGHTLVLLDGIPLNSPISTDREFDGLDQLFLDDVDRVELVRGPQSSLYGSNATAGVINIVTQKGQGPIHGSFLFDGGSYKSFREAATASAGDNFSNFALSLSRFDTEGFPSADKSFGNTVNNGDVNTTGSLRFGLTALKDFENNLLLRFDQSRTNVDAQGGEFGDDPNYFVDDRQWVLGNQSTLKLLNGDWEQTLGLSFTNDLQKFTDDLSSYIYSHYERGTFEGQTAQVNWQNNFHLWNGETLVAGLQGQEEWGREDDTTDYGYGLSNTFIDKSMTTTGGFFESQTALEDRFFATLGGRVDSYSQFGSQFTYRLGAAYFVPGLETKLKATYGTGFKAPSIYQLYSPYGDLNLTTESSQGWDVGMEQSFAQGKVSLGATYFRNHFTNLIDFGSSSYDNISEAQTEGWETFVSAKPVKDLELKADYTYTWALNLATGEQLLRRPQSRADFSANYKLDSTNFGLNVVYVGARPDLDFSSYPAMAVTMASYTLVNLRASYQVDKTIQLFGRVNNLLNTNYEEVFGYGTPGLSFYVGTKIFL